MLHNAPSCEAPHVVPGSASPHWLNKQNRAPLRKSSRTGQYSNRYAESLFECCYWTAEQWRAHLIDTGGAISVGVYRNNWRKQANLISAQMMGVDSDGGAVAPD
jgi:hypothetical protein